MRADGGTAGQANPRLAPVLRLEPEQTSRQVCLLDSSNRLSPWVSGVGHAGAQAELDFSLRPVVLEGAKGDSRPGLGQFASAYDSPACLSIWLLRKRPEERCSQARRLAFWELGAAVMGLEKTLALPRPWQFAFWVPGDSRFKGLWLLDLDLRPLQQR